MSTQHGLNTDRIATTHRYHRKDTTWSKTAETSGAVGVVWVCGKCGYKQVFIAGTDPNCVKGMNDEQ